MAKKGYIYKYTYPNGMLYIGATSVSVKQAYYQHKSASKDPSTWTLCEMAIFEYGEPTIETIETIEVADNEEGMLKELLKKATEKWIKEYDSTVESGKGFNVHKGKRISWIDYLLQKKWYEIYDKEKWAEKIEHVKDVLESIGTKICVTKEELTQEEKEIWYEYKFKEFYFFSDEYEETTFSSYYERHGGDWGNVPYEALEVLSSKNATPKKKAWAEQTRDLCFFEDAMREAVEDHWLKDIEGRIWEKVKEQEKELVALKELQDEKEIERRQEIGLKVHLRALRRYYSQQNNE
ncbi:MAG: hypothetical protein IKN86_10150 [Bacteroidaceae bacterium]|nr:hypothetical protein [Bacteroidaceae bacterium]